MPDYKQRGSRPMVKPESVFLAAGDHPSGAKIFIRRGLGIGKRKMRGIAIGPANERERAYIEEHFPEIHRAAYPSESAASEQPVKRGRGRPRKNKEVSA